MRKIMISLAVFMLVAGMALADTIRMRDGSVKQGRWIGYEGGYFIFQTSDGEQVKYSVWQVNKIVVDQDRDSDDYRDRRYPGRDSDDRPSSSGAARWESAQTLDVRLQEQWVRSQVQVRKGQRVRVEATGTVSLEGRYSVNPDGRANSRSASLPMPGQNDGALIAIIGRDEDAPPIYIGRQREFVADRNGQLFFSVNHWETRNAGGAFRVTVSVDRGTGGWLGGSGSGTQRNEKVVTLAGNKEWVDTGIDLASNMTLDITAEGQIRISSSKTVGPDGNRSYNSSDVRYPMQNAGVGAVIAKVRYRNGTESALRFIGARNTNQIDSNETGRLFIGINDNYVGDNSGSYRVTIRW